MEEENIPDTPLIEVKDLHVSFRITAGKVEAVNGVSFSLNRGKILGIVGESGSGKSVSSYSILQIIDKNGTIDSGSIKFDGKELIGLSEAEMREIRGNRIAMIFQDPMTALNPVYSIGNQLIEAIRTHEKITKKEAYDRAIEMLRLVGFNEPEKRMKQYPFEFSGGMLQRAVIAMALVCNPDLLIADEPTTALDVTIQAQILELLKEIQQKMGMAIIIITHDLGVVASICDEVDVMYAGRIVERGTSDAVFYEPAHEYTKGLINSVPTLADDRQLVPIKGNPVDLMCLPKGCPFASRCDHAMEVCIDNYPPQMRVAEDHLASCWQIVKKMQDEGVIDVTQPPEAPENLKSVESLIKAKAQVPSEEETKEDKPEEDKPAEEETENTAEAPKEEEADKKAENTKVPSEDEEEKATSEEDKTAPEETKIEEKADQEAKEEKPVEEPQEEAPAEAEEVKAQEEPDSEQAAPEEEKEETKEEKPEEAQPIKDEPVPAEEINKEEPTEKEVASEAVSSQPVPPQEELDKEEKPEQAPEKEEPVKADDKPEEAPKAAEVTPVADSEKEAPQKDAETPEKKAPKAKKPKVAKKEKTETIGELLAAKSKRSAKKKGGNE